MSDTVKLVIEMPKELYENKKGYLTNMDAHMICKAVRNGIPLEDVKAEIGQFREALAEKAPSLRDLITAQQTIDVCLGFIDNIGKGK